MNRKATEGDWIEITSGKFKGKIGRIQFTYPTFRKLRYYPFLDDRDIITPVFSYQFRKLTKEEVMVEEL